MIGKKFETLEDWTKFMSGKSVYIIKESHPNYREKCRFVEMIGKNNLIAHPDNKNGIAIRMKVKTVNNQFLLLNVGEFFIDERSPVIHLPKHLQ
jgi:hypothetical protein